MAVDQRSNDDWPVQAADTIERLVGQVRDKTAGPAVSISRSIVYGLVAALVGFAVLVMLCIALVRLINNYLPQEVWAAHLIVGLLFCSAGFFLWSKRS
jgi:predicted metal-binding membrane protein